ncbi:MAG TPA: ABC-2 family transporter protein [Gemmatimonadaceae bacterium]|nr:ABC-2 family transporter protein [Gemmatimonadaceae bacterium]
MSHRISNLESRISRFLSLVRALIRAAWLVDLQYRAAIVIWMSWSVLDSLISLGIWWSIAGAGAVGGYERSDFARYFFAVTLINQLTVAWDAYYIDRWIRNGEINFRLARPIPPILEAMCDNLAYKARTATMLALIWLALALAWPAVRLDLTPGRIALTLAATVGAAGIRFLNGYATGLLAFWTTRATAVSELQWGISMFLSGRLAPLTLLPPAVATVAGVLWFRYTLSFPVEVLTGQVDTPNELMLGFLGQTVWLVIWFGIYRLAWTRGIQRYGAVGG